MKARIKKDPDFSEMLFKLLRGDVLAAASTERNFAGPLMHCIAFLQHCDLKNNRFNCSSATIDAEAKQYFDNLTKDFPGNLKNAAIVSYCGGYLESKIYTRLIPFMISSKAVNNAFEYWFSFPEQVGQGPKDDEELRSSSDVVEINTEDDFLLNLGEMIDGVLNGSSLLVVKNIKNNFKNTMSMFNFLGEMVVEKGGTHELLELGTFDYLSVRTTTHSFFYTGIKDFPSVYETACLFQSTFIINECADATTEKFKPIIEDFAVHFSKHLNNSLS